MPPIVHGAGCAVAPPSAGKEIGLADEGRDEGIRGLLVEPVGRIHLRHPPAFHHDHAIADGERLGLIVRDHDGRRADLALDPAQLELHLLPQLGVEIGERLVQQENRRRDDQGAGDGDALPLAARELAGITVGEGGELHQ